MSDAVVPHVQSGSISTTEMDFTQNLQVEGKKVSFFGLLVLLLWPRPHFKPEYELHIRTGTSDRMCRWFIDGTHPPNAAATRAVMFEILTRLERAAKDHEKAKQIRDARR